MKYLLTLIFNLIFILIIVAQTNPNHVWVKEYRRSDGTYVSGHYRTAPNHTNVDNFSTRGNVNPYTLEKGWVTPGNQDNPWDDEDEVYTERNVVNIEPYYGSATYNYRTNSTYSNSTSSNYATATNSSNSENINYWYSKGDQVNVRFSPSATSRIAFRINRGNLVQVKGKSSMKDYIEGYGYAYWYEVSYNDLTGWVFGKLIGERNYDSAELDNWNGDLQYINANSVNVRTEPDTRIGKVLFQLNKYREIEILAKTTQTYKVGEYGTDYWYYIKADNQTGWVFGGLIEL